MTAPRYRLSPFGMDDCCICDAPATHTCPTDDGELLPYCERCARWLRGEFPGTPLLTLVAIPFDTEAEALAYLETWAVKPNERNTMDTGITQIEFPLSESGDHLLAVEVSRPSGIEIYERGQKIPDALAHAVDIAAEAEGVYLELREDGLYVPNGPVLS